MIQELLGYRTEGVSQCITMAFCILRNSRGFVACPFFMPDQRFDSDWLFPHRLPLGAGWAGTCTAPGHEGARPGAEELKSSCNLGYAKTCFRLPSERHADAVRFALGEEREGILRVLFACERDHQPAGHGELLYQIAGASWPQRHGDARVQRMAECYVAAQRSRRGSRFSADTISEATHVTE
jgi:hypothetical protein